MTARLRAFKRDPKHQKLLTNLNLKLKNGGNSPNNLIVINKAIFNLAKNVEFIREPSGLVCGSSLLLCHR